MEKKIKCKHCKKKLKLITFKCKCGYTFCVNHQVPHIHNCTFDYVKETKDKLKKNNPKIKSSMETKILK